MLMFLWGSSVPLQGKGGSIDSFKEDVFGCFRLSSTTQSACFSKLFSVTCQLAAFSVLYFLFFDLFTSSTLSIMDYTDKTWPVVGKGSQGSKEIKEIKIDRSIIVREGNHMFACLSRSPSLSFKKNSTNRSWAESIARDLHAVSSIMRVQMGDAGTPQQTTTTGMNSSTYYPALSWRFLFILHNLSFHSLFQFFFYFLFTRDSTPNELFFVFPSSFFFRFFLSFCCISDLLFYYKLLYKLFFVRRSFSLLAHQRKARASVLHDGEARLHKWNSSDLGMHPGLG
eukprot:gene5713-4076_t